VRVRRNKMSWPLLAWPLLSAGKSSRSWSDPSLVPPLK
jgi:hypothetical protein